MGTILQAAACILDCWDVIKGEALGTTPQTYDLLVKPTCPGAQASAVDIAVYNAAKTVWKKKNAQALGLMLATVSPIIWQDFVQYGMGKDLWDALETQCRNVGGATTYLQLVNMVKIQFTNSMDLLPQIQGFQDNYTQIMLNGHSRHSKDLATFMFCSSIPESYEPTAWQYLENIMVIANYKLTDIIA